MTTTMKQPFSRYFFLPIVCCLLASLCNPAYSLSLDKAKVKVTTSGSSPRQSKSEAARQISEDMTMEEVLQLLGNPAQKVMMPDNSILWIYLVEARTRVPNSTVTIGRRIYMGLDGKTHDLGPIEQPQTDQSDPKKELRVYFTNGRVTTVTE